MAPTRDPPVRRRRHRRPARPAPGPRMRLLRAARIHTRVVRMALWDDFAAALAAAVAERDVLAAVADVAARGLDAEWVTIFLLQDDGESLRLVETRHTSTVV